MIKKDYIQLQSQFIQEQKLNEKSKKTLSKYDRDVQKFIDFIPDDLEITKEHILEFKDHLCAGRYQTSSINNYLTILNTFLKWCGQSDLRVRQIKTQQQSSLSNVVSEADAKRLLRFAKKRGRDDLYLIMKIILTTGIRINELEWFTVANLKHYHFSVNNKGKERDIILTQELTRELRKYCRDHRIQEGPIFTISYSTIWRQMKTIAGAARVKLDKVHPHSFRHLFAKAFMAQYNNVLDLADILGHSSLETTRIYTRSSIEEKRDKLEKLRSQKAKGETS
jgi:integrase/recombinase XerD